MLSWDVAQCSANIFRNIYNFIFFTPITINWPSLYGFLATESTNKSEACTEGTEVHWTAQDNISHTPHYTDQYNTVHNTV